MEKIRKEHNKIVAKAKTSSGVENLRKVYQRFQQANAITTEYMRLISPEARQVNSNKSLLLLRS